ncbi:putative porin [Flavobacteriaceae bacterium]|nr:putative porin [Flavobacteriaceae bacterium]
MNKVQNIFLILILCYVSVNAQTKTITPVKRGDKTLTKSGKLNKFNNSFSKNTKATKLNTTGKDYKFISVENDTTFVDTTLSIKKEYRYNYLRKDYFELLPFSNTGQVFNKLGYDFSENNSAFSRFGARAKHIDYAEVSDVKYYNVPTPLSELFFKTTMEQGQLADVLFTANTSPQLNIALTYKGLRSLGKYRHMRTNGGKFAASVNYNTKSKRYFIKTHLAVQSIENQENGGVNDTLVVYFENNDEDFKDRARFDMNFEDADNKLSAKRFYINHYVNVFKQKDSLRNYSFKIGHIATIEDKKYQFNQTTENAFFGDAFQSSISDEVRLEQFYNEGFASFENNKVGNITVNAGYTDYNYGYNSLVFLDNENIPNRIKGGFASYGANYKNSFGKLHLAGSFKSNLSEDNDGYVFQANVAYPLFDKVHLKAMAVSKKSLPDFNYRLYQSDYKNYNWYNPNLQTVNTNMLAFELDAKKYGLLKASYSTIKNYTYFGIDAVTSGVTPFQYDKDVNYLKLTANKEVHFRKIAFDNTLQYQKVTQTEQVLNVPDFIVRSSLYFSDHWFQKNLFIQFGVTGSYFTKYFMNDYDPLLSEFYVQTEKEFGDFPRLDFFINAKVRNARIYLKAEHFNSAWTGNNFYSAPNYPYKDFIIRFGLVWNFFM